MSQNLIKSLPQIAGVGAQVWSCMDCSRCKDNNENYCPHQVDTYNAPFPDICGKDKGLITQGGYSTHYRADKRKYKYNAYPGWGHR